MGRKLRHLVATVGLLAALVYSASAQQPADVEIEIGDGPRAVARRVSVSTGRPGGVLWNIMSRVPVRDLVGTACLMVLHRGRPTPDGKTGWMPIGPDDVDAADELQQIVRDLVGYRPEMQEAAQ